MPFRPGTEWGSNAPELLCSAVSGTGSTLGGALVGAIIGANVATPAGAIPGALIGSLIGSFSFPFLDYALCGGYTSESPIQGSNIDTIPNLTREDLTFDLTLVQVSRPPQQIYSQNRTVSLPPDPYEGLDPEGSELIQASPAFTVFPLYAAVGVRNTIKNRKFGCALHEPISNKPLIIDKCTLASGTRESDREKEKAARFLTGVPGENDLTVGFAILSTVTNKYQVNTALVTGPTDLAIVAANYAAMNNQLILPVQTKVHILLEQRNCTVPQPSVNLGLRICNNCENKSDPYIEILGAYILNREEEREGLRITGLIDGKGSPLLQVTLQLNGQNYMALPPPFTGGSFTGNDPTYSYVFTVNLTRQNGLSIEGSNTVKVFARNIYGFSTAILDMEEDQGNNCFIPIRNLKDSVPGNEGYKTQLQIIFQDDRGRDIRYLTIPDPKDNLTAEEIKRYIPERVSFGNIKCEVDVTTYGYMRYYAPSAEQGRSLLESAINLSKGQIKRDPLDSFRASDRRRTFANVTAKRARAVLFIFNRGEEPKCKRFNLK